MFRNVRASPALSGGVIAARYVLAGALASLAASSSLRVIGGRDATENELPYVVRLEYVMIKPNTTLFFHVCTSSVVTNQWTLTARHCVDEGYLGISAFAIIDVESFMKSLKMVVRYGSPTGKLDDSQTSQVIEKALPPTRYYGMTGDDIALLRTEPIMLKKYGRLSSLNYDSLCYDEMLAVGYGVTNVTHTNQSEPLLADTRIFNRPLQVVTGMLKKCEDGRELYPMLCMSQSCGQRVALCWGDSGGPVIHRSGIVALNSQAPAKNNCQMKSDSLRNPDFAAVLPISPYLDWINNVINKK